MSLALLTALILSIGGYTQAQDTPEGNLTTMLAASVAQRERHDQSTMARLSLQLANLYDEYSAHLAKVRNGTAKPESFTPSNTLLRVSNGRVAIDAVASGDAAALQANLEALGMQHGAAVGSLVGGWLPIESLEAAATLDGLRFARPSYAWRNVGLTTSQGDPSMNADSARSTYSVNGSGITVGTLSDSYDCLRNFTPPPDTNATQDVANNDLPAGVNVLADYTESDCIDEGRGMMQLIHDVAPGASQQFHTAFISLPDFAQGIRDLANAGSDVIVDDIIYFAEPMFQDGIVAQAVDDVVAQGVPYFSSAGNNGRDSYESSYRFGQSLNIGGRAIRAHDFDPGAGVDVNQRFQVPAFSQLIVVFQWDQPFASASTNGTGSANDVDIYFSSSSPLVQVIQQGNDANIGDDAVEIAAVVNNSFTAQNVDLLIGTYQGSDPGYLKYVIFGGGAPTEFATNSSTVYGHANAAGASAVGAAAFYETPRFGVNPPLLEDFSSAGPTPIFFNKDGSRKSTPELRQKPEIVAPDGTNTTFFGDDIPQDADTYPNFFGTSAAAPHAAAVAALMLDAIGSLTPSQIYTTLQNTAIDMGTSGVDDDTGYGLIQADRALGLLLNADVAVDKTAAENDYPAGQPISFQITVSNNANGAANNVTLTDTLPAGVTFISASYGSGTPCNRSGNTVTCNLGTIASRNSVVVTVVISTTTLGNITNTASATTSSIESNNSNNSDSATVRVVDVATVANLGISGSASASVVGLSAPLSYTLTVNNAGPANASNVTVVNTLPAGVTFGSASGSGWSCNQASGVVTCTRPSLNAGESAPPIVITITSRATPGSMSNTATVSSNAPDTAANNNSISLLTQATPPGLVYQTIVLR